MELVVGPRENLRRTAQLMLDAHSNWRRGQAFFNAAWLLNEDVTSELYGSSVDPYYDDSRTEAFIQAYVDALDALAESA